MFKSFKLEFLLSILVFVMFNFICASVPEKELSDARKAIMESEKVNANKYAHDELLEAKQYLETAEKQVENKKNDPAKENALKAKEMGDKAYFKALAEFMKDQNESTKKSMDEAKESHADKLVPDKYQEGEKLYNEAQKDLGKVKILSEKLKVEQDLEKKKQK